MVKIHANASVSSLIANNPTTQVEPSMGMSVAADIKIVLPETNWNKKYEQLANYNVTTS